MELDFGARKLFQMHLVVCQHSFPEIPYIFYLYGIKLETGEEGYEVIFRLIVTYSCSLDRI